MLQSHRRATTVHKGHVGTVPPLAPFVILLGVALIGMAHGSWHGHWLVVALNVVTVAVAIWGLRLPHQRSTSPDRSPATGRAAESPRGVHLDPSPQGASSRDCPQPVLHGGSPRSITTEDAGELPVVGSFAITGRIHRTAVGTAGCLTVVLPMDINVVAAPVVNALLTAGHRLLEDRRLTHRPLPEVEVTTVDRAERPPSTSPATGFTVHVTNDLATRHSDITIDAHQLMSSEDGALLIAATLLAGADHLLDAPDHVLHYRTPPTRRPRSHREEHAQAAAPR